MAKQRIIVVLNAGSSSVKFAAYQWPVDSGRLHAPQLTGELSGLGGSPRLRVSGEHGQSDQAVVLPAADTHAAGLSLVLDTLAEVVGGAAIAAVGHRVVHGGEAFSGPARITPAVLETLRGLVPLAPLHMPHNLAAIELVAKRLPAVLQVACFDTAFHRTCTSAARRLAIPRRFHEAGLKRYGFHGLSYEYIVGRMQQLPGGLPRRTVLAHLGAGASLCGVLDGHSVTTTMGYTPLDGLVMATRSGSIGPGAVLALLSRFGLSAAEAEQLLSYQSGLLGVSGISGDLRLLLASDSPAAAEAVALFCRSIVREIAAAAAELGGLEGLVFTGGVGANSPEIRSRVCRALSWLGVMFDEAANRASAGEARLDAGGSVAVWALPTDEQSVIAAAVAGAVGGGPAGR
jgi:acetate kinase